MRTMNELDRLWKRLGTIPVDSKENITEPFDIPTSYGKLSFSHGTSIYDIWSWFEDQHPDFIVGKKLIGEQ